MGMTHMDRYWLAKLRHNTRRIEQMYRVFRWA